MMLFGDGLVRLQQPKISARFIPISPSVGQRALLRRRISVVGQRHPRGISPQCIHVLLIEIQQSDAARFVADLDAYRSPHNETGGLGLRTRNGIRSRTSNRPCSSFLASRISPRLSPKPRTKKVMAYVPSATVGSPFSSLRYVLLATPIRSAIMTTVRLRFLRAREMSAPSFVKLRLTRGGSVSPTLERI
jgi:hypothetical protein